MLSLRNPVLGVGDLPRATRFWCELLGYRPRESNRTARWCTLEPVDGPGTPLALMASTAPAEIYPRVHLDFDVADSAEQEAVADRIVELGGSRVAWPHYPDDADFLVVADTEGNRFCLIDASRG